MPKKLDRTITFNNVTFKNTDRTSKKIFSAKRESADKIKNDFRIFFSTFQEITVGGFVNQLIKNSGLIINQNPARALDNTYEEVQYIKKHSFNLSDTRQPEYLLIQEIF